MGVSEEHSVDIESRLKLIGAEGVGPVTFFRLIKHFGSAENALGVSVAGLEKIEGVGPKTADQIARSRNKFDAKKEIELADELDVTIISFDDERYPRRLKNIYSPPPLLYFKGSLSRSDNLSIAIVGSRKCSLYGQDQASRFAYMLSSAGFTVCS